MKDLRDYSLLKHNTFGIDARCRRFVEVTTTDEARQLSSLLGASDQPLLVLGGGSNLLLTGDFPGTVIHAAIKGLELVEQDEASQTVLLRVGSGEVWDDVVSHCIAQGWYGTENLSLIPGEVGASAVQNIGAYGAEVSYIIYKVEAVRLSDGQLTTFDAADCQYAYRWSRFKGEWRGQYLITHVTYRLSTVFQPQLDYGNIRVELERRGIDQPTAHELRQVVVDIRRQKLPDPQVEGNAGSFFVNPVVERQQYEQLAARYPGMPHYCVDDAHEKIPAGWLIEQCGWKGRALGPAAVHDRQALVLVNRGGATGQDIVRLSETICQDVRQQFGIDIHPEVNIV
ncbi:MAG: UDP-N-acetylmuramate dehydrogenase [Prevotella sp.]|nr:UDP-N-acetylmuramate dehydrogenase [Prevotella sp.]